MKVKFLKGNIIDARVDAIILPANTKLKKGRGASEAIFNAAGKKDLIKACKKIDHCEVGSAVPTLGYNLPAKFIIHAVVPKWIDGKHKEYALLSTTYVSALELADAMECKSIVFPLLASGNNGFNSEVALEVAIKSIESYVAKNLESVSIVLFGNYVTSIVKDLGFEVMVLPRNLEEDEKEKAKNEVKKQKLDETKDAIQEFMENQIKKGIEFLQNPKNKEIALKIGLDVVKMVMKKK